MSPNQNNMHKPQVATITELYAGDFYHLPRIATRVFYLSLRRVFLAAEGGQSVVRLLAPNWISKSLASFLSLHLLRLQDPHRILHLLLCHLDSFTDISPILFAFSIPLLKNSSAVGASMVPVIKPSTYTSSVLNFSPANSSEFARKRYIALGNAQDDLSNFPVTAASSIFGCICSSWESATTASVSTLVVFSGPPVARNAH